MSTGKAVITVKDTTTFTLNEADLTETKVTEFFETQKFDVVCSDGLEWWIRWYPAGDDETAKGHVSAYLHVNKPVNAKCTFEIENSPICETYTYEFSDSVLDWGWTKYAPHETLRPLFHDGKLHITCNVKFYIPAPMPRFVPKNYQLFHHLPTDVELVMGSDRMPAHKSFLSMISPVFHSIFSYNTAESKSGVVQIYDFDVETVKAAVDLCYGRELTDASVDTVVKVLWFCNKYFLTAVTDQLEPLLMANLSTETFCNVILYAYDFNRIALLTECYKFFKEHQDEVTKQKTFADLPPTLVIDALKSAFDLKTNFDVLRRAYKNGIDFVVNHLEQPLFESMTLDDFCSAVSYAWDCSRDELKEICNEYFADNRDEVLDSKAFHNLPSDTIGKVIQASYARKLGDW